MIVGIVFVQLFFIRLQGLMKIMSSVGDKLGRTLCLDY